ncbi:MAG: FKBP-type peptidyl-prolyl cis-trans isomerase [Verrucomicrobiales bacterium]
MKPIFLIPAAIAALLIPSLAAGEKKPAPGGAKPAAPAAKPEAAPPSEPKEQFPSEQARQSYALGAFFANRHKGASGEVGLDYEKCAQGFNDILGKDPDYAIGASMAAQLMRDKIEVDGAQVMTGFKEGLEGKEAKLSQADVQAELQKLQQSINQRVQEANQREAGKNEADANVFFEKNRAAEGVKTTESGLQYKVIEAAKDPKAPKPSADDTVLVNYRGTLLDGTEFDSSPEGQPRPFGLRNVVKGWTEGMQLMQVGSKYRFWVPASLGYGNNPRPGKIKPGHALVFDIDLVRIEPKPAVPAQAQNQPPKLDRGEKATAATPPIAVEIKDGKPRVTAVTPPVTVEIPPRKPGEKKGEAKKDSAKPEVNPPGAKPEIPPAETPKKEGQ